MAFICAYSLLSICRKSLVSSEKFANRYLLDSEERLQILEKVLPWYYKFNGDLKVIISKYEKSETNTAVYLLSKFIDKHSNSSPTTNLTDYKEFIKDVNEELLKLYLVFNMIDRYELKRSDEELLKILKMINLIKDESFIFIAVSMFEIVLFIPMIIRLKLLEITKLDLNFLNASLELLKKVRRVKYRGIENIKKEYFMGGDEFFDGPFGQILYLFSEKRKFAPSMEKELVAFCKVCVFAVRCDMVSSIVGLFSNHFFLSLGCNFPDLETNDLERVENERIRFLNKIRSKGVEDSELLGLFELEDET